MEYVTAFGMLCGAGILVTLMIVAFSAFSERHYHRYYRGVMDQIADARNDIASTYRKGEPMSADMAQAILRKLYRRETPRIEEMKQADRIEGPNANSASNDAE